MKITESLRGAVRRVDDCIWEIPPTAKPGMLVPARLYASEAAARADGRRRVRAGDERGLPARHRCARRSACRTGTGGTASRSAASPPSAPTRASISPGGIGFDINCGMRLIRTDLTEDEVRPRLQELVDGALRRGAGGRRREGFVRLSGPSSRRCMVEGRAAGAWRRGYAWPEDLARIEGGGCLPGADPARSAQRAWSAGWSSSGRSAPATTTSRSRWCGRARPRRARGARARRRRPRPGLRHAPLRLARLRAPDRHRLPQALRPGDAAVRHQRAAIASWRARPSARRRARPTSAP